MYDNVEKVSHASKDKMQRSHKNDLQSAFNIKQLRKHSIFVIFSKEVKKSIICTKIAGIERVIFLLR